eukprot:1615057-Prymnesium_polylepis.1
MPRRAARRTRTAGSKYRGHATVAQRVTLGMWGPTTHWMTRRSKSGEARRPAARTRTQTGRRPHSQSKRCAPAAPLRAAGERGRRWESDMCAEGDSSTGGGGGRRVRVR